MSSHPTVYVGPFIKIKTSLKVDVEAITEERFFNVTELLTASVPGITYLIPNLSSPEGMRNFSFDPREHCDTPDEIEDQSQVNDEMSWVVDQFHLVKDKLKEAYQAHPDRKEDIDGDIVWGILVYVN